MNAPNRCYHSSSFLLIVAILMIGLMGFGCSEDLGVLKENQPPNVWLSGAPPEGTRNKYVIHLFWGGWDPDGEIQYYEYAITDNDSGIFNPADTVGSDKWHRVFSNDSIFTFTADVPADSNSPDMVTEFIRSHTFFIRAVDEEGLASLEPAYRSFTAQTLTPTVDVEIPRYNGLNPALLPPITTFRWVARDYVNSRMEVQEPDSVRWILVGTKKHNDSYEETLDYIRRNPKAPEWYPWTYYQALGDSGRFWTSPPLAFGTYIFAMQAKDEAGAVTPVFDEARNVRRVLVSKRTAGPLLTVINQYIGAMQTSSENTPLTILDLPAGVPITFEWRATAESYGGIVSGYRYAWDIYDLTDDEQWDIDYTPFIGNTATLPRPRVFWYGTHTFYVEVIDNSGFKSRIGIKINIFPFTMERDLLVVDDYREPAGWNWINSGGANPSDEEHDALWINALKGVAGFDPEVDFIEVEGGGILPISTMAQYRSIIWDAWGGWNRQLSKRPLLYDLIRFIPESANITVQGRVQPNLIALFLASGGRVLLCGEQPLTMSVNRQFLSAAAYPLILQYELLGDQDGYYEDQAETTPPNPVGDRSFGFLNMCVDILDVAYTSYQAIRSSSLHRCGIRTIRSIDPQKVGLRECIPADANLPPLTLRDEAGGPGKAYYTRGLNTDLYNPPYFTCFEHPMGPRDCFEPMYLNGCNDVTSNIYEAPVGLWTSAHADSVTPRSVLWGFEPVFFDTTAVREALEYILFEEWGLDRK